jgi:hypothetical protein
MRPQVTEVSAGQLRELFNRESYATRIVTGQLIPKLLREGHPAPPRSHEPPCTKNQIIAYFDEQGRQVAIIHQYVRTDGSLGASGRPDPKKLYHKGVLYVAR